MKYYAICKQLFIFILVTKVLFCSNESNHFSVRREAE